MGRIDAAYRRLLPLHNGHYAMVASGSFVGMPRIMNYMALGCTRKLLRAPYRFDNERRARFVLMC
jgi:hypothetical protein